MKINEEEKKKRQKGEGKKKPNQPNKNNTDRKGARRGEAISEPQPGQESRSEKAVLL